MPLCRHVHHRPEAALPAPRTQVVLPTSLALLTLLITLASPAIHAASSPETQPENTAHSRCPTPVAATEVWQQLTGGQLATGGELHLVIDLATSPGFELSRQAGEVAGRYRMGFNQIAEGWNWFPQANPAEEDYYHHKFLPLASVEEQRGEYAHEDKIGVVQQMQVRWRYDYFLAFENLYDFYPRGGDDDAGFVARWPEPSAPDRSATVRLQAQATLLEASGRESSTFWKATYGKPVDFMLKKRYFMARLDAVHWCDAQSGRLLASSKPAPATSADAGSGQHQR